jgi:hypothetical protein
MRVIKIKRTIRKAKKPKASTDRRDLREFARNFFATENHWEFAIEALIFAILLATAAWPIVAAAGAINGLLQTAAS